MADDLAVATAIAQIKPAQAVAAEYASRDRSERTRRGLSK
jgi:hypothetical protein